MKYAAYQAERANLKRVLDFNMRRCAWSNDECVTHMSRNLPNALKLMAIRCQTVEELLRVLDKQFTPETTVQEEEEWDNIQIGSKSVASFYNELQALSERLEKNERQVQNCFVKGFKDDYPQLWRRLRMDCKGFNLNETIDEAKEWIEIMIQEARAGNKRFVS